MDFEPSVPKALEDAIREIAASSPVGTVLTSEQLAALPAEIRRRAFFSSRVVSARLLTAMRQYILDAVKLSRGDSGEVLDRSLFVELMQQLAEDLALRPSREFDPNEETGTGQGSKRNSLRDIGGQRRLELIFDTNVQMAQGYSDWMASIDPEVTPAWPCSEFLRVSPRITVRDWPKRWADAGGQFWGEPSEDYPDAPGRMIAKKGDPIFTAISAFGQPWEPFDFGSGMGLEDIDVIEARELGVVGATERVQVDPQTFDQYRLEDAENGVDPELRGVLGRALQEPGN